MIVWTRRAKDDTLTLVCLAEGAEVRVPFSAAAQESELVRTLLDDMKEAAPSLDVHELGEQATVAAFGGFLQGQPAAPPNQLLPRPRLCVCVHTCDPAVHEKRIHGRTGKNRVTAVQEKKLARPYRKKVDTAVYTRKMLTRPCTHCVHFLSSVRLHTHFSTVFSFVYILLVEYF